jgi:hypothetical protein
MTPDAIQTATARISLGSDDVVRVLVFGPDTLATAQANIRATGAVVGGRRLPVLVDLRRSQSIDREARACYGGPVTAESCSAVALLVQSPLSRMLANFFLGWNKALMPLRLFTDESEALAWLKSSPE